MVVAVLLSLVFLFVIRDILLLVFLAIILAAAITAPVDWLDRKGVPRALSVLFLYIVFVGLLVLSAVVIIPPIVDQFRQLLAALPVVFSKIGIFVSQQGFKYQLGDTALQNLESVAKNIGNTILQSSSGGIFSTLAGIFGGFFSVGLVLVMTFYLVVQENGLKNFIRSVFSVKHRPYVTSLTNRIEYKIGLWFRGQLTLGLVIFVIVYIGLSALGVPYALVLAVAAGLLEAVPYVGPIIAALPAVLFAFGVSPARALFVVIFYIVVQQAENHILVPKIMQKAVGLNPVVIIIALLVGAKLAGIAGILISVPVATAIGEFLSDFSKDEDTTPETPQSSDAS
jgi:predicted PurR-regulated permease PerM